MFDLQKYNYSSQNINIDFNILIQNDGIVLFDASFLCNILGYKRATSDVINILDADEKILLYRYEFDSPNVGYGKGPQSKWFVTESGLYSIIFKSNKTNKTKQLIKWITNEILPSIRKTGKYEVPNFTSYLDILISKIIKFNDIDDYHQNEKVYFIKNILSGFIKIGFTSDLKRRLKSLFVMTGQKIKFLKAISGGREKEIELHRKFNQFKVKNTKEWFHPYPELEQYIQKLKGISTI